MVKEMRLAVSSLAAVGFRVRVVLCGTSVGFAWCGLHLKIFLFLHFSTEGTGVCVVSARLLSRHAAADALRLEGGRAHRQGAHYTMVHQPCKPIGHWFRARVPLCLLHYPSTTSDFLLPVLGNANAPSWR